MVGKNNQQNKLQVSAKRIPHFGLRKLSIGVASVLLSTMAYLGVSSNVQAATKSVSELVEEVTSSSDRSITSQATLRTNQRTVEQPDVNESRE
jgi:hypothetical protein